MLLLSSFFWSSVAWYCLPLLPWVLLRFPSPLVDCTKFLLLNILCGAAVLRLLGGGAATLTLQRGVKSSEICNELKLSTEKDFKRKSKNTKV